MNIGGRIVEIGVETEEIWALEVGRQFNSEKKGECSLEYSLEIGFREKEKCYCAYMGLHCDGLWLGSTATELTCGPRWPILALGGGGGGDG